jgi:hypothetical protein
VASHKDSVQLQGMLRVIDHLVVAEGGESE